MNAIQIQWKQTIYNHWNTAIHGEEYTHRKEGSVIQLELDMYELSLLLRTYIDQAKATGIICLMGVGLGFGLTSWIIYKVYHRSRQKDPNNGGDEDDEDLDKSHIWPQAANGQHGLNMGNTKSLHISAGINIDEDHNSNHASGIRHRNSTHKHICASIVEDESGAYISRTALQHLASSPPCVAANQNITSQSATHSTLSTTHLNHINLQCDSESLAKSAGCNGPTTAVTSAFSTLSMNDSGYMDTENSGIATSSLTLSNDDAIVEPTSLVPTTCDYDQETLTRDSSDISSLSDKQMRDLGLDNTYSDLSSCRSSCGPDSDNSTDEEVLQIEIEDPNDDTIMDSDKASMQTLFGCILDAHAYREAEISSPESTLTLGSLNNLLGNDDAEISHDSNYSCTHSLISQAIENRENSRPSSTFSSPLLTARSGHSRSSSVTSADIDLEATLCTDNQAVDDIEIMEMELNKIKREIDNVEGKLMDLMSVDTTSLYFNVDGMKKLTEVVMSSDNINLTTSEIAKAFQILRKYRYTFTTPEKKPAFGHNEAESLTIQTPTTDKSLPYLDLADSSSCRKDHKRRSVVDWVDGLSTQEITFPLNDIEEVLTEMDIEQHKLIHPMFAQGYSKLAEDQGFSKIHLVKAHEHACLITAYSAKVIHSTSMDIGKDELNVGLISKTLDDLVNMSHSYLQAWDFTHITESADVLLTMKLCVKMMVEQMNRLGAIPDKQERITSISDLINQAVNSRALIIEGIRILTFVKVNELYQRYVQGNDIPLHGWMLFARESSSNPRYYFTNHIQNGTRELEQVDLSLLADALNVTLQVFSPLDVNTTGFHHIYPENDMSHKQCISLAVHSSSSYAVLS